MQFCILYCELKESVSKNSDSFTYFSVRYNSTNNLIKDIKKSEGVCKNLHEIIDIDDCVVQIYTLLSYDIIASKLRLYENLNFELYSLSSFLGLPETWGLYEIFSYYFDAGYKVLSDIDMIDVITTSVLTCKTDIQYTYCVYFLNNNKYSLSWFYIDNNSNVKRLGDEEVELPTDSTKGFILGKFIKSLRYKMAVTGCCIARTKFLTWDESCVTSDISKYILGFKTLSTFFKSVQGLEIIDYDRIIRLLSNNLKYSYDFSSSEFVSALSQSSKCLGLKSDENGNLVCNNSFRKDYSSCVSNLVDKTRCKWGIILDCEGNRNNGAGLRELGGIIFCRYKDIMLSVETFECTEILLEETLQQTIKNYEVSMERYIPSRGIDIYTFGGSDEFMIEDSLKNVGTKQFRKRIKKVFKYHDCREYIYKYIEDSNIQCDEKKTLSNIAKVLGVQLVTPKHNALADSRTLFNVLAFILQDTNCWFLD